MSFVLNIIKFLALLSKKRSKSSTLSTDECTLDCSMTFRTTILPCIQNVDILLPCRFSYLYSYNVYFTDLLNVDSILSYYLFLILQYNLIPLVLSCTWDFTSPQYNSDSDVCKADKYQWYKILDKTEKVSVPEMKNNLI